jgi:hypothetical protein
VLEKVPGHEVLSGIETLRVTCSFLYSYAAPLRSLNVGVTCNCPVHSAVIPVRGSRHLWGVRVCRAFRNVDQTVLSYLPEISTYYESKTLLLRGRIVALHAFRQFLSKRPFQALSARLCGSGHYFS